MRYLYFVFLSSLLIGCANNHSQLDFEGSNWAHIDSSFTLGIQFLDKDKCIAYAATHNRDGVAGDCVYKIDENLISVQGIKEDGSLHDVEEYVYDDRNNKIIYKVTDGEVSNTFTLSKIQN